MSDRVPFLTSQRRPDTRTNPDTSTVDLDYPASSGFTAFPFRPRLLSKFNSYYPGDARYQPLLADITYQQMIEVYWRVRRWRITVSGTAAKNNPTPPPTTLNNQPFSFSTEVEMGTEYTYLPAEIDPDTEEVITPEVNDEDHSVFRERDLCQPFAEIFGEKKSDSGTDGLQAIIQVEFPASAISSLAVWNDVDTPEFNAASLFRPAIAVGIPSYGLPFPFANRKPFTNPYAAGNPQSYTPVGDVTITLSDGDIVAADSVFENNDVTTGFSCDIAIEAIEWWPYLNTEGDPVFNTSSGARVADPYA